MCSFLITNITIKDINDLIKLNKKLNFKLKLKRILHTEFCKSFQDVENVEIIKEMKDCQSNYWLITMRLNGNNVEKLRDQVLYEAHKSKINLRPSWELLNQLPMYRKSICGDLSEAINQSKRLINLPSSPQLLINL